MESGDHERRGSVDSLDRGEGQQSVGGQQGQLAGDSEVMQEVGLDEGRMESEDQRDLKMENMPEVSLGASPELVSQHDATPLERPTSSSKAFVTKEAGQSREEATPRMSYGSRFTSEVLKEEPLAHVMATSADRGADTPEGSDGLQASPSTNPEDTSAYPPASFRASDDASNFHLVQPVHRSSHAPSFASSSADEDSGVPSTPTIVYGVVLVAFHHSLGPIVEYSHPPELKDDEDINKNLPFLALPDGAHLRDEDYSCFHLYLPKISRQTVYGISCIRQLRSDELLNRTPDITRSTVQKAVVVLANKPVFGPIRDKLGVITRTFFAQRDFENTEILADFYTSLEHALQDEDQTSESAIYMGMSLRELVWKFRMQTLTLFKLLLLQRKVMFYGVQVERLCAFQYSLISLVPLLLMHLEDAASPLLESRAFIAKKPSSLKTSDRRSLLSYIGLPLNLFGIDSFFQPYLPLQQLEVLQVSHSYLVGTTNSIFQAQRDCQIEVVVNIDNATIEFRDSHVASLVTLTAADRKWMDDIVKIIEASWNPSDPHRPLGMGFKASDDWLRFKFEEYICSALSAIKFVDFLGKSKDADVLVNSNDPTGLASFNESWLAAFRQTHAFEVWDRNTDPVIFDLVEPRHPCEGQAHLLEDVGIRLANGLHDLHLDERLGPTQEVISKGIATGSEGVWRAYSSLKADLARRQAEYKEKKAKEEKERAAMTPEQREEKDKAEQAQPAVPEVASQVLASAAEVGGKAASFASSFGSFLGSKLTKQRSQTFTPPAGSQETVTSSPRTSVDTSTHPTLVSQTSADPLAAKPSFFSSWRTPAAASTAASAPAVLPTSTSTATREFAAAMQQVPTTPPLTSPTPSQALSPSGSMGGFFRRVSGGSGSPSFLGTFGRQHSSPVASPAITEHTASSVPEGDQDVSAAFGRNEARPSSDGDLHGKSARSSLSMNSDRFDADDMKDVNL